MANRSAAHSKLVKACLGYLHLSSIPAWPSKTQGQFDPKFGGFRKFVGMKGISDITGLLPPTGRGLFVEVKTGISKASKDQKAFRDRVEAAGGLYILARNLDDLADGLK